MAVQQNKRYTIKGLQMSAYAIVRIAIQPWFLETFPGEAFKLLSMTLATILTFGAFIFLIALGIMPQWIRFIEDAGILTDAQQRSLRQLPRIDDD